MLLSPGYLHLCRKDLVIPGPLAKFVCLVFLQIVKFLLARDRHVC